MYTYPAGVRQCAPLRSARRGEGRGSWKRSCERAHRVLPLLFALINDRRAASRRTMASAAENVSSGYVRRVRRHSPVQTFLPPLHSFFLLTSFPRRLPFHSDRFVSRSAGRPFKSLFLSRTTDFALSSPDSTRRPIFLGWYIFLHFFFSSNGSICDTNLVQSHPFSGSDSNKITFFF